MGVTNAISSHTGVSASMYPSSARAAGVAGGIGHGDSEHEGGSAVASLAQKMAGVGVGAGSGTRTVPTIVVLCMHKNGSNFDNKFVRIHHTTHMPGVVDTLAEQQQLHAQELKSFMHGKCK